MKKEVAMPDFVKMEEEVLKFWEDEKCFEKLVEKNKNSKKHYRFLDGPITANYPMGIHHVWGRTLKDTYLRFKSMDGYSAHYQNGFDAHGLPVEIGVEKDLGLDSKKDIVKYGIDKFVEKCMDRVRTYSSIQTEQSKRLGQWMDWNNSYYTNTDENITSIWYFLNKCKENGWIAKSSKPMQWCPRCGTSLSEHEMHGSYKEVEHIAVFFKAPILNENRCIVVWTTTPWTLSSNVAVAVNPDNEYVECKVKSDTRNLIVGKEALKVLKDDLIEVVKTFKGSEIVGLSYETCFNELEVQNFEHKIVPWEDVSATDGTGAVHIAPGCGVEDFELGKKLGLKEICPIDENGVIYNNFGVLSGYTTQEVRDVVFDELEKRNKLYYTHKFKHSYPICWRCKHEIVFRLIDGWFIKVDEIRPKLIKACETVTWQPDYLGKRMVDWLNNMGDWNISRSRFYGIPLPFYPCEKCGELTVVGSIEELKHLAVDPTLVDKLPHIHRPYIDEIKIKCPHCGNEVTRVTDVGDCWLDAGITPYSTKKYFTDRKFWEQNFPAENVIEMREQIRLWFYSMLFMSVALTGKAPYEKVVGYESVVQEDGSRFSKSGFMIKFDDFANKLGADCARYMFAGAPITSDIRFGYSLGEDARRRMLAFWNAYTFFNTYACIDNPNLNFKPDEKLLTVTDKWLLEITNNFIKNSRKNYEENKSYVVVSDFENLLDNITNFYIRANRRRFWKSDDEADKLVAYWCLYTSLKSITQVMAPIIPFMTEHIWQNMVRSIEPDAPISVFLADFPTEAYSKNYPALVNQCLIAQNIITLALKLRNENNLKVKQPLSKLYVVSENKDTLNAVHKFIDIIKDEVNIKSAVVTDTVDTFNDYYLTVNFKTAGAVLKQKVQELKKILEEANEEKQAKFVEGYNMGMVDVFPFGLLKSDIFIKNSKSKPEFIVAKENDLTVVLDITLTEDLVLEGLLREIIRNAQILRKEANFNIEQRVYLNIVSKDEDVVKVISKYADKIKQEVLAEKFNEFKFEADIEKTLTVSDKEVAISLKGI